MGDSKISWTDKVWNPVTGCTPIASGCKNCYAKRMSQRLKGRCGYPADEPFRVTLHPDRLEQPLRWKKPRMVFVCSMGDLFHDEVPDEFLHEVFAVMASTPHHTFQVLTKRPDRMREFLSDSGDKYTWAMIEGCAQKRYFEKTGEDPSLWLAVNGPLSNVWLGYSASTQKDLEAGIEDLVATPAALRFLSLEPLIGQINLWGADYHTGGKSGTTGIVTKWTGHGVDWVITGAESGVQRRPMSIDWVRQIRDQCKAAGTPFFLKQMEVDGYLEKMPELDGEVWAQMPELAS